jgi:hypothetical protein
MCTHVRKELLKALKPIVTKNEAEPKRFVARPVLTKVVRRKFEFTRVGLERPTTRRPSRQPIKPIVQHIFPDH